MTSLPSETRVTATDCGGADTPPLPNNLAAMFPSHLIPRESLLHGHADGEHLATRLAVPDALLRWSHDPSSLALDVALIAAFEALYHSGVFARVPSSYTGLALYTGTSDQAAVLPMKPQVRSEWHWVIVTCLADAVAVTSVKISDGTSSSVQIRLCVSALCI